MVPTYITYINKTCFKVEYHANATYEYPLNISEKNSMCSSKDNVSNFGKKNTLAC